MAPQAPLTIGQIELPKTPKQKQTALTSAIEKLKKDYGDPGLVTSLGSKVGVPLAHFRTGMAEVDRDVIGIGGVPRGRVTEVFGPEGGGKTTITLTVIAEAQRQGEMAAFVDAEHALDPTYAKVLGVDVDNLIVSQPDYGEQALEVAITLIETGGLGICVIDSVAALVPLAELTGDMESAHMGLQARMMGKAMRKLASVANRTSTAVIFINQIREKLGVMFGNPETTPGGRALKFAASLRLDVRKTGKLLQEDANTPAYGHTVKIKAIKNKVSRPFRECTVDLLYGIGFDQIGSTLDFGVTNGTVEKSGAWYNFKGERLGCGLDKASKFVRDNQELWVRIQEAVMNQSADVQKGEAV